MKVQPFFVFGKYLVDSNANTDAVCGRGYRRNSYTTIINSADCNKNDDLLNSFLYNKNSKCLNSIVDPNKNVKDNEYQTHKNSNNNALNCFNGRELSKSSGLTDDSCSHLELKDLNVFKNYNTKQKCSLSKVHKRKYTIDEESHPSVCEQLETKQYFESNMSNRRHSNKVLVKINTKTPFNENLNDGNEEKMTRLIVAHLMVYRLEEAMKGHIHPSVKHLYPRRSSLHSPTIYSKSYVWRGEAECAIHMLKDLIVLDINDDSTESHSFNHKNLFYMARAVVDFHDANNSQSLADDMLKLSRNEMLSDCTTCTEVIDRLSMYTSYCCTGSIATVHNAVQMKPNIIQCFFDAVDYFSEPSVINFIKKISGWETIIVCYFKHHIPTQEQHHIFKEAHGSFLSWIFPTVISDALHWASMKFKRDYEIKIPQSPRNVCRHLVDS